ncbi:RapH N-terminal domain-containing protein [Bacillus subtilis]|uniref:response regulator aspartate phosphatase n=1 Tax=Bacillus subtilis group TaxID=653685 RepID=UPI000EF17345|nr:MULTISPECIES: RapH N-terminal domain-containing protein [Bacillus subtilis group]AYK76676.1 aspartate phosphatase [Bacillus subtilis subsp. subtilis]AYL03281.1 aspartate phosphatase [Bacillus subtilis subsp. subtilis]MEC0326051.1 RapH N-terminal domain-containing protein [Bacillus subtilis]MEC0396467.1 RapH N-terminal domain-containing protein [Bacillus subtilis]MEC0408136.1 RapH N-terminal domain-containing protein [Bacillus subtilis]
MEVIPSADVGIKINEWHMYINRFDVENSERLKAEVEQMMKEMEEDQNLLLYYQLIVFRHRMMLDYLFPSDLAKRLDKAEYLRKIEGKGKKLSGMLEYYTYFFKGMHEFSLGKFIRAIESYKKAEKKLTRVLDAIEKAEFYYKMAEVFYHMKQTHVSMFYVEQAYDIYKKHDTYKVRMIHCLTVVAGNYIDLVAHDQALPHLQKALKIAEEISNTQLMTKALLNVGCCYNGMDNTTMAIGYFRKAAEVAEKAKAKELTQIYYELALIHFKQDEKIEGREFYNRALESAQLFENDLFLSLLKVVNALFIESGNRSNVLEAMEPLRDSRGYPYLEELALEAAQFYTRKERMDDSVYFYREMVHAQKQIQRGDFLYEI